MLFGVEFGVGFGVGAGRDQQFLSVADKGGTSRHTLPPITNRLPIPAAPKPTHLRQLSFFIRISFYRNLLYGLPYDLVIIGHTSPSSEAVSA